MGTPFYLAPELCYEETCQPYSVKSDVWALGVILYELCALKKPFVAANETELYQKITNDKVAPIPRLNADLMGLINRLLNKNPSKRPTVRQIIDSDYVRNKAVMLKIELPKRVPTSRLGAVHLSQSTNLVLTIAKQSSEVRNLVS